MVNGLRQTVVVWNHQKAGVEWMCQREHEGKRGGIVADEMGLGKTLLGIARIVDGCPTSVDRAHGWAQATLQWESEVKKFANGVNVVKHHGLSRSGDPLTLRDTHVIITSYATMASEFWELQVCTVSHEVVENHIRNWAAKSTEACFNVVGRYQWCFTGTPIDLQEFKSYIVKPIKGGQVTLAIEWLQVVLSAVMLRRQKDVVQNDALHLPDHHIHGCLRSKVEDWVKQGLVKTRFACVLEMLLRLHQACDHPMLVHCSGIVDKDLSASSSSDSLARLISDEPDPTSQREFPMHKTSEIFQSPRENDHILTLHIDARLVQQFLSAKGFILAHYDGSMSLSEHEWNLQYIENDMDMKCILISIKAGSIVTPGLNFTACNNIILLEPWWNPAVKEQAFDCMHQIGQLLPVNIYKLVVQDSMEERMLELQNKKWTIADTTLDSNTMSDMTLDIEDPEHGKHLMLYWTKKDEMAMTQARLRGMTEGLTCLARFLPCPYLPWKQTCDGPLSVTLSDSHWRMMLMLSVSQSPESCSGLGVYMRSGPQKAVYTAKWENSVGQCNLWVLASAIHQINLGTESWPEKEYHQALLMISYSMTSAPDWVLPWCIDDK
ncbi:P-loop containing nucleoside triphosphate hydrolase protein [Pisolithus marmoratus]|nr:P-loop containing nucleoside triphosphate hydrolase protein [Pisolithus marmoratus]